MSLAARMLRRLAVAVATAALVFTVGTVVAPLSESSGTTTMVATAGVNVRSGPGTQYSIVGGLARGSSIQALGGSQNGWTPVSYSGTKRWISSQYLTSKDQYTAAASSSTGGTSTASTTAALNARTGAGLNYRVVYVLPRGTSVTLTGRSSGEWRQISYRSQNLWVSSRYLTTSTSGGVSAGSASTAGTATTTANLNARTGAGTSYRIITVLARGTTVTLTGRTSGEWREITWSGRSLWVSSRYLSTSTGTGTTAPVSSTTPTSIGTRYATVSLNIRSASSGGYVLTTVPAGTALQITGVTRDGREQVIYQGAVRWVTAGYLSATAPAVRDYSSGLAGLVPSAAQIVAESRVKFPTITTYYGVRPDSLPDHPSGRAVDIMIPGYRTSAGQQLGTSVAEWAKANASRFNVEYIIWNQRIWSVARSGEGWRYMADRGSDTANHKDHVHITVRS